MVMVIQACSRCGFDEMDMPGFEDGTVPETDNLNELVCKRCDLRAIPIEFDDPLAYRAFRATAHASWQAEFNPSKLQR